MKLSTHACHDLVRGRTLWTRARVEDHRRHRHFDRMPGLTYRHDFARTRRMHTDTQPLSDLPDHLTGTDDIAFLHHRFARHPDVLT